MPPNVPIQLGFGEWNSLRDWSFRCGTRHQLWGAVMRSWPPLLQVELDGLVHGYRKQHSSLCYLV